MNLLFHEETAEARILLRHAIVFHEGLLCGQCAAEVFLEGQVGIAFDEKHDYRNDNQQSYDGQDDSQAPFEVCPAGTGIGLEYLLSHNE